MIDLHIHLIPGIDDGPATVEEAVAMARAVAAAGTVAVAATPHVDYRYGLTAEAIAGARVDLVAALEAERVALEVHQGAEISLARLAELDRESLAQLTLGDGDWLLVECPFEASTPAIEMLQGAATAGYQVLLAHPERCPAIASDVRVLERLVGDGALAQVTAGAFTGVFGRTVKRAAEQFMDAGLVHVIASDAHDPLRRGPDMAEALMAATGRHPSPDAMREWLSVLVPAAILAGEPVPDPPAAPRRRRRRLIPW